MSVAAGRLATILNRFRDRNPYGGTSYGFFYLTNECNYRCDICYMDSRPGLTNTRLNSTFALGIISELQGIDEIVLSGGEPTLHPSFNDILQRASQAARFVTLLTNGSEFLDRANLREVGDNPEGIAHSVKKSMEESLSRIPPNVEIVLPVTEYHLVFDGKHRAHKYHEAIVKAGAELAREWASSDDRPKIRFIVKNTPDKPSSGEELIQRFGIDGLGSTGARFPGSISGHGRAGNITKEVDSMHSSTKFAGGIHINHQGVFANEPSLLERLHFDKVTQGKICSIGESSTTEQVVQQVIEYLLKYE